MSHSRQTEHYELPLYNGTDVINPLTDFNNANEAIDLALYNANVHSNEAKDTANAASASVATYDTQIATAIAASNAAAIKAENVEKMMAEEFDPLKVGGYNVGDIVIHDGHLYYFINRHTGAWDASDVAEGNIGDAMAETIEQGKQEIAEETQEAMAEIADQTEKVTHTQVMIAPLFDADKDGGYAVGDVVTYADKLYRFTGAHSGAWTGADVEQIDVEQQVSEMKQSFQDGVDTIYGAITAQGVTPSSSTPSDCATAIGTVATNKYNAGKNDAEGVTWDVENMASWSDAQACHSVYDMSDVVSADLIATATSQYGFSNDPTASSSYATNTLQTGVRVTNITPTAKFLHITTPTRVAVTLHKRAKHLR